MKKILISALLSLSAFGVAQAQTTIFPTTSYSAYTENGANYSTAPIFAGDAADHSKAVSRLYEVFTLPSYVAGTSVTSAVFFIGESSRYNRANNPLGLYTVSNDVGQTDWATKPALGTLITSFNPDQFGNNLFFDVTSFVNQEYSGDGVASLAIAGLTEGKGKNSWTYFVNNSGYLTLAVSQVAEPATVGLFGLGLLGAVVSRRKRMKKI